MSVVKTFGKDFHSDGGALTLGPKDVGACDGVTGTHTATHADGWTITGEVVEDYFYWVNEFSATHPQYGRVWGNFENEVRADSEEGFQHFWKHHEPSAWDYFDI